MTSPALIPVSRATQDRVNALLDATPTIGTDALVNRALDALAACETADVLALIANGTAFPAAVEYALEDAALITTDDGPYAKLTEKGQALVALRRLHVRRTRERHDAEVQ